MTGPGITRRGQIASLDDGWTGASRFLAEHPDVDRSPVTELVARAWPHQKAPYRPPEGIARSPRAVAEVNHGRWVIRCPFCPGAMLASREDRRFFCVDCLHAGTQAEGKWLAVRWPSDAELEKGERLLATREVPMTRNWDPARESVADLDAENRARGVE